MKFIRAIGFTTLAAACILATGAGCTHHHYYYTTPGAVGVPGNPCDPAPAGTVISSARPVVTTPTLGAVCDDPPQGSVAVRSTPMVSSAGPVANSYSVRRVSMSDGAVTTVVGGGPGGGQVGEVLDGYGLQALMNTPRAVVYDPTSTPGNERLYVLATTPYSSRRGPRRR